MQKTYIRIFSVFLFFAFWGSMAWSEETSNGSTPTIDPNFYDIRNGLPNCRVKFAKEKKGRVVYLGGSITAMKGWRDLTYDILKKTFPETEFDFINAGIGGTNSTLGAFRFQEDVFKNGPVDLLFLEFAVNDGGSDTPGNRKIRAMEGIIRQARKLNPAVDILMQYFVTEGYVKEIQQGKVPEAIADHEKVAQYYQIPILNLAKEMTRRITGNEFVWEQFSGDSCHPKPFGHQLYADCIQKFLHAAWKEPLPENAQITPYSMPAPLDSANYEYGHFVTAQDAKIQNDWLFVQGWKTEKTCNYSGPVDVLTAEKPGATLTFTFHGSLAGFYAIAGMDAGILEYSIDNGPVQTLDLFDNFCIQFHRPVCHILVENLCVGEHTLKLTTSDKRNDHSVGNAVRILKWVVN